VRNQQKPTLQALFQTKSACVEMCIVDGLSLYARARLSLSFAFDVRPCFPSFDAASRVDDAGAGAQGDRGTVTNEPERLSEMALSSPSACRCGLTLVAGSTPLYLEPSRLSPCGEGPTCSLGGLHTRCFATRMTIRPMVETIMAIRRSLTNVRVNVFISENRDVSGGANGGGGVRGGDRGRVTATRLALCVSTVSPSSVPSSASLICFSLAAPAAASDARKYTSTAWTETDADVTRKATRSEAAGSRFRRRLRMEELSNVSRFPAKVKRQATPVG